VWRARVLAQAELARVKTQWVASEVYKLDSLFSQARAWAATGPWACRWTPASAWWRVCATSAAEQVQAVAARYFGDDQLTVATLLPQPPDPKRKPRPAISGGRH
jgi:zinc protease